MNVMQSNRVDRTSTSLCESVALTVKVLVYLQEFLVLSLNCETSHLAT